MQKNQGPRHEGQLQLGQQCVLSMARRWLEKIGKSTVVSAAGGRPSTLGMERDER